jgi:CHAT domain-containing protein
LSDTPQAAGWALKAACYEAWHRDPAASRQAAAELATLAAAHADNAELQALAAWTAGIAALTEGRLPDALGSLQQAQTAFEARGEPGRAAETRVPQIGVLAMLGRETEAQACAEGALAQFIAAGDVRSAGKVELNLGSVLFRQDRHAEAEPHFRRAALRFAQTGDAELSIGADVALANLLGWQFRFDEALQMYERARLRALPRGLHLLVAQVHQGVGQIEMHRGHGQRALQELAAAARLAAESGAPPQRRIEAEAALADAYLAVRLRAEAVRLYDALVQEALAFGLPTERAWATLQRARAHAQLGDAAAATAGFAQAEALYTEAGNGPVLGLIALEQGRLALAQGDAAAARACAQRAQAALQGSGLLAWQLEAQVLGADADAAAGARDRAADAYRAVLAAAAGAPALPQLAWPCHAGLGALAQTTGDLAGARRAYEQALAVLEELRAALPGDELRSAQAEAGSTVHDGLVAVAQAQGSPLQLLVDMERGRARSLALALAELQAPAAPTAHGAEAAHLQWLRQQWRQTLSEGDAERAPALAARVQALEQKLLEAHRRSSLGQPLPDGRSPAAPLAPGFGADDLPALQAALGPERALVAYHLQGETLLACVVTADGVAHRHWAVPGLAGQVRALRFQMDALRHGDLLAQRHGALLLERVRHRLQALHAALWAPLLPLLGGRTRCVLLPHRDLHAVPFAALHDGRHWLVQHTELAWAPSAAVWLALQQRPAPRYERALVLGVGDPQLPQVEVEAQQVAAAFGTGGALLLGQAATRAALARAADTADVLHLACHGQFRADNPAFSSVLLGDGPLTLLELAQLQLPAGLVALSACETGASRVAPGEELQGLVRSCLRGGASTVLATFWPVEDRATAALALRFYAGLHEGLGPAGALQRAQAQAAQAGHHPYAWAGFALHGRA